MPRPRKELESIFRYKHSAVVGRTGTKTLLRSKLKRQLEQISADPAVYSKNSDLARKLDFLINSDLDNIKNQRMAVAILNYIENKSLIRTLPRLTDSVRNRSRSLELHRLYVKSQYLKSQLVKAEKEGTLEDINKYTELFASSLAELERFRATLVKKAVPDIRQKKQIAVMDPEKYRQEYEAFIESVSPKYYDYLEKLVDETKDYFGYENADFLVNKSNRPFLDLYLDLVSSLDKEFSYESKLGILSANMEKFSKNNFFKKILYKTFYKLLDEFRTAKKMRGALEVKQGLWVDDCVVELNKLLRFAIAGKDVFLEDLEKIYSHIKLYPGASETAFRLYSRDIVFIPAIKKVLGSFPDVKSLDINACKKSLGLLSFLSEYKDEKLSQLVSELTSKLKTRIENLQKASVQKPRISNTIYLYSNIVFPEEHVLKMKTELGNNFNDTDIKGLMILLVKGANLIGNKPKPINAAYYKRSDFERNAVNGLTAFFGNQNMAKDFYYKLEQFLLDNEILVLHKEGTAIGLNNFYSFKYDSIREFCNWALRYVKTKG